MKGYTDIHCHTVMTHYRNPELNKTACDEIHLTGLSEDLRSSNTQSDFGKLVKGNLGGIIISLYPIERKWFLPKTHAPVIKEALVSRITGFSVNGIKKLMREEKEGLLKYYDDLVGEYEYLLSQVDKPCHGKQIKIARNYAEFEANNQSGDTVSIIISIEGGHALGTILPDDLTKKPELVTTEDYTLKYRDNVFKMKNWGPDNDGTHTPFFITLSHHFWNMLVGHSESLAFIFDQKTGKESGFTDAGRAMLNDLLSSDDAMGNPDKKRRVLVDVKHMSPLARKQYYSQIKQIKNETGLNIPIICSHASVGDARFLDSFIKGTDKEKAYTETKSFFNTCTLSLTEEDIYRIIQSDGLIGIIFHENRIAAKRCLKDDSFGVKSLRKSMKKTVARIENMQLKLRSAVTDEQKQQYVEQIAADHQLKLSFQQKILEAFINMVMANIYKIVEVYAQYDQNNPARGWDHVCIGSDFDGTINKMDLMESSAQFPLVEGEMIKFLHNPRELSGFDNRWKPEYLKTLQFGHSPEILAHKFMSSNTAGFLKKYFTESYLVHGVNPS